jgi:hypothetical protein
LSRAKRQTNRAPACPRVPVCLLDELLAGVPVEIRPWDGGASFALVGIDEAKPLAKRKHERTAKALLEAADDELRRSAGEVPAEELERRRRTRIITPQRPHGEPAHYAVVEAEQLVASHDPQSFAPDARYPEGLNERDYRTAVDEQRKVMVGAQTLDPALLLTDTPTAVDGPPIVTSGQPLVLGGNGRSMMLKRAYGVSSPAREANPVTTLSEAIERRRSRRAGRAPNPADVPEFGPLLREMLDETGEQLDRILQSQIRTEAKIETVSGEVRSLKERVTKLEQLVDPKGRA